MIIEGALEKAMKVINSVDEDPSRDVENLIKTMKETLAYWRKKSI